jgi:L-threonylcarbamoyladenylate synthase
VTTVLRLTPDRPEPDAIAAAAARLRDGGLVAFPTETVYGLGVAALDAAAERRLFAAKGRPADDPLIVHVADAARDAARRDVRLEHVDDQDALAARL